MDPIYLATGKVKTIRPDVPIEFIQGGSPYVVTTTQPHQLESGDLVQLSFVPAFVFTITVFSATKFWLNETLQGGLLLNSQTATVKHLGYTTNAFRTDQSAIPPGTQFYYSCAFNNLNQGCARVEFDDTADYNDGPPGPAYCTSPGPISQDSFTAPSYAWQGMNVSQPGNNMRCKVFLTGGPGSQVNFTAFLH